MDFLDLLRDELKERKKRNSLYSNRAFAMSLDEEPSFFNKIINEKKPLTAAKIYKYATALGLKKENICEYLLSHLEDKHQKKARTVSLNQ